MATSEAVDTRPLFQAHILGRVSNYQRRIIVQTLRDGGKALLDRFERDPQKPWEIRSVFPNHKSFRVFSHKIQNGRRAQLAQTETELWSRWVSAVTETVGTTFISSEGIGRFCVSNLMLIPYPQIAREFPELIGYKYPALSFQGSTLINEGTVLRLPDQFAVNIPSERAEVVGYINYESDPDSSSLHQSSRVTDIRKTLKEEHDAVAEACLLALRELGISVDSVALLGRAPYILVTIQEISKEQRRALKQTGYKGVRGPQYPDLGRLAKFLMDYVTYHPQSRRPIEQKFSRVNGRA